MSLRPPISTRTDPLFPSPPLFRSPDPIYFKRVEQIRSALRRRTPRGRLRARQNVLRAPPKDGPPCPRGERPCRLPRPRAPPPSPISCSPAGALRYRSGVTCGGTWGLSAPCSLSRPAWSRCCCSHAPCPLPSPQPSPPHLSLYTLLLGA